MKSRNLVPLLCVSFIIVATVTYYWPFLTGNQAFYYGDHNLFFEPLCRFIGESFRLGRLPLWNPLMGCGQSQIAIVSPGVFYPTTFLFALLPYSAAVALQLTIHQLLAAVGCFLLVRKLGWGDPAAALSGLVFALNGYMFGFASNFTLIFTAAWLPLAIYCLVSMRNFNGRERAFGTVGTSLTAALTLIGGRPEVWAPSVLILLAVLATEVVKEILVTRRVSGISIAQVIALFCGLLVAAPSIMPAFEWALLSPRTVGGMSNPLAWSCSWYDFSSLIFGLPFGDVFSHFSPLGPLAQQENFMPLLPTAFFGPTVATLAMVSLADRSWSWRWIILACLALAAALAAGANLPFFPWLLKVLPPLSLLRYPVKLQFLIDFIVALMSARGLFFLTICGARCKVACAVVTVLWVIFIALGLSLWLSPVSPWLGFHQFVESYVHGQATEALKLFGRNLLIWSSIGSLSGIAAYLLTQARTLANKFVYHVFLVGLTCGSLLFAAFSYCRFGTDANFYDAKSFSADVIKANSKGAVAPRFVDAFVLMTVPQNFHKPGRERNFADAGLFGRNVLEANEGLDYRIGSLFAYEGSATRPLPVLQDYSVFHNSQLDVGEYHAPPSKSAVGQPVSKDLLLARLCQMSSTGFVISQREASGVQKPTMDPKFFDVIADSAPLNIRIFKTKDALPYAYYSSRWLVVPSERHAVGFIQNAAVDNFDPRIGVIVSSENDKSLNLPSSDTKEPTLIVPLSPDIARPEFIRMRVHAPKDGVVVVNDNLYPGWKVMVDDAPATILKANSTFKAVFVQAGWHDILFSFEPSILRYAFLVCLVGMLLCAACALFLSRLKLATDQ